MTEHDNLPPLDSLDARIRAARGESKEESAERAPMSGKALAVRSGTELIAGIAVGGFLGYHLDEWLGTRPAFIISGIFLGMAGGVMNIYRAVSLEAKQQQDAEAAQGSDRDTDDAN